MLPLFDAHCDTITACMHTGLGLRDNNLHTDLKRGMNYAPFAQVFAIFDRPREQQLEDYSLPDTPEDELYGLYLEVRKHLKSQLEENSDIVSLCLSANDAKRAAMQGKCAAFIAVEGAELLACDTDKLSDAYDNGVRLLNLCWNFDNSLTGAAKGASQRGLSPQGVDFVRFAQDLGVILDMSHISEKGFWDVLEISTKPIIASHSNSKAVWNHPRNLADKQFSALMKAGGVAGLNLCPDFLGEAPDIDICIAHIEHFLSLGGEKAVCIGSDFDGIDGTPAGISGIQDLEKIYQTLLRRNHSESLVRDIFYNNLMDLMERVL